MRKDFFNRLKEDSTGQYYTADGYQIYNFKSYKVEVYEFMFSKDVVFEAFNLLTGKVLTEDEFNKECFDEVRQILGKKFYSVHLMFNEVGSSKDDDEDFEQDVKEFYDMFGECRIQWGNKKYSSDDFCDWWNFCVKKIPDVYADNNKNSYMSMSEWYMSEWMFYFDCGAGLCDEFFDDEEDEPDEEDYIYDVDDDDVIGGDF